MALLVNTNVSSLNAQRNLMKNSSGLNTTLERLSSGLRINKAADDAAGLSISEGFKSQIRGLNQAVRNANDGLSLLGVAESAISEQSNILQRLRELAVQAANDTNSVANRTALNQEVETLKEEFDRIAKTVQFNGIKLLDGTFTAKELQVGAFSGASERLSVTLEGTRSEQVGRLYSVESSSGTNAATLSAASDVKISIGGKTCDLGVPAADGVSTAEDQSSALAYKKAFDALGLDVTVEASTSYSNAVQDSSQDGGVLDGTNNIVVNGVTIQGVTLSSDGGTEVADEITAAVDGVTATVGSDNKITLVAEDGRNIAIAANGSGATITGLAAGTHHGKVSITAGEAFDIVQNSTDFLGLGNTTVNATKDTQTGVAQLDVTTKDKANKALQSIDQAIKTLASTRATIGAQTNRINSVISNLSSAVENISAANSRIVDADFAKETAELTRTQILQQASIAILAQANQAPQVALTLLR